MVGGNFTLTTRQQLRVQNTLVGIGFTELTVPFDTFNYRPFFKHCILQIILQVFLLLIFVWNKIFCSKIRAVFYIFCFGLGWNSVLQY